MAQNFRTIPANFPHVLGNPMVRAESQRQISILRQEVLTDLLGLLGEAREPGVRSRIIRLAETYLKSGIAAAQKSENLWPEREQVEEVLGKLEETVKPAMLKKHRSVFEQFDRVHQRSLELLEGSFENIRLILDRVQPPEASPSKPTPESKPGK